MKRKALLTSVLTIALCLSLIAGSTFALFTSSSSVNIAVTAGNVEIVATIDENSLKLYSPKLIDLQGKITDAEDASTEEGFANGGTAELVGGNTLNLENVTPGDKVSFNIKLENKSNVNVLYRTRVSFTGDSPLFVGLNVNIGGTKVDSKSDWAKLEAEQTLEQLECFVELPADAGNEYQEQSCSITFTVEAVQGNAVEINATEAAQQDELTAALAGEQTKLDLALAAGTYTLPAITDKTVTVSGTEDVVIDMTQSAIIGAQNHGLDITFDGVTVKFDDTENYKGITHAKKLTYRNCTIYGKQFLYATDVEFVNCTFVNSADYTVWTYGADNATFAGCTFNCGGKAILIYCEDAQHTNNVTVTQCVFNDNGALDTVKAAIEIGDSQPTAGLQVNLIATNNTINGFAHNDEGTPTGTAMWGNKNAIPAARLNVIASNNTENDATVAVSDNAATLAKVLKSETENISVTLTEDVSIDISLLNPQIGGSGEYRLGGANTKQIDIDLNGHKLTLSTTYMSALGANNANAVINVKNGSITSTQTGGTWNIYDLIFANCTWNFEDVTFDKAVAIYTGATATMKNVVINDSNDVYALWITADAKTVTLDEVTINCPNGRAIAIKDEYRESKAQNVTLNISNTQITSAKKAAVLVSNVAGATIVADNVDISAVAADSTNLVWRDNGNAESGTSYSTADITVNGCTFIDEP